MAWLKKFADHFALADGSKQDTSNRRARLWADPGQAFLMKGLIFSEVTIQEQAV